MPLLECVPNFSEGRDKASLEKILDGARGVPGVFLLDYEMDGDHHRSVVTLAGEPEPLIEAVSRMVGEAIKVIDLNRHEGEHPRMGATDVVPFVPLEGATMDDAIAAAHACGERLAKDHNLPVFFYGDAAKREGRSSLPKVRKGQFEKLKDLIGSDPDREPDAGPNAIHPTAGATAVGARPFLIAYNVNLKSQDLDLAKAIGKAVREKDGGFKGIRGMGFELAEKNCVQVSMNVTDYKAAGPATVFKDIERRANEAGVEVMESEIIGLIPQDALTRAAVEYLQVTDFTPDQVVENRLAKAKGGDNPLTASGPFLDALASKQPAPGGGSASALSASMAASLGAMVVRLTQGKKKYADVQDQLPPLLDNLEKRRQDAHRLVELDAEAYNAFGAAMKLPKGTDEEKAARKEAILEATRGAIVTPTQIMECAVATLETLEVMSRIGNKNAISDVGVGAYAAHTALFGGSLNVGINLGGLPDGEEKDKIRTRTADLEEQGEALFREIKQRVRDAVWEAN